MSKGRAERAPSQRQLRVAELIRRTLSEVLARGATRPAAESFRASGAPPAAGLITGIIGAVFGAFVFNAMGIRDARARGFAMGIAAHGIGTARAFQEDEVAGTFSGVAMALNGIVTALVLPLLWLAFAG